MSGEAEFEAVVDRNYEALYRFALSLTGREGDACDLTQETFFIWVKKREQLIDPSKTKAWLFTTLHRLFLGRIRKTIRFPDVTLEDAEPELPAWEMPAASFDRVALLQALQKLPPDFHAAVALFYLEDYSHPEIAEILEIPLGTVKSRISRGILRLQGILVDRRLPSDRRSV